MLKKYSLLLSVLVYAAGHAEETCTATCIPCSEQACSAQQKKITCMSARSDDCAADCRRNVEVAGACDASATCKNMPESENCPCESQRALTSEPDAVLQPCKSQIDLEAMFPVESWKKFCQSLSVEEQNELKRMTEEVNCCFNKLSEELGGTLKIHKQLMEKYKKHKGITTCCYSLAFNLVPQEVNAPAAATDSSEEPVVPKESQDTSRNIPDADNPEFTKSLNPAEQTEFDALQAKLQEIGRRTSAQVVEIFESNKPLKAKLQDFCNDTKHCLLLTMSCDHPQLSETIKIVN